MSFGSALLITGSGLAAIIGIVSFLLFHFGRRSFSFSFAVSHLIFIVILSAMYFPGEKDAQHQFFWMLPGVFDLPVSLSYPVLALGNMSYLALAFAFLGTVQYAAIGWVIDLIISKDRKKLMPRKAFVIPILVVIGLSTFVGYTNWRYLALPEHEKAVLTLGKAKTECDRFHALNDAAKTHFEAKKYEAARLYADELLGLTERYREDWNYGNAVYDAHTVLGRLALLDGKVELSKEHLFAAVKTPGSPTLDTFGPNMSLAKDLLERGQKDTVVAFLNECKRFWYDHQKADEWIKGIRKGEIPDFGANLAY